MAVVSYGLISQGFSGFTHTAYSTKKENNHGRSEIRHHLMLSEIKELIDPDNQWEKLLLYRSDRIRENSEGKNKY